MGITTTLIFFFFSPGPLPLHHAARPPPLQRGPLHRRLLRHGRRLRRPLHTRIQDRKGKKIHDAKAETVFLCIERFIFLPIPLF